MCASCGAGWDVDYEPSLKCTCGGPLQVWDDADMEDEDYEDEGEDGI